MIVRPMRPENYGWLASRAQLCIGPQFRAIEAVGPDGRVHAACGYDSWTQNAVSMHVALDNPAALRALLGPGFRIPFVEFGKGVVLATVLSTNARSLALVPKLGFREVARLREAWAKGVDLVLFEMRREECRFLGEQKKEAA